jgi:spore germination cell wall hydrolase CwlJ-like protein
MEARGEPQAGQIAVAMVLYRRADFNQKRICSEMARPYQFSWYGKIRPPEPSSYELRPFISLAKQILTLTVNDTSKGADHFHEKSIPKPMWAIHKPIKVIINNHIFY